MISPVIGFSVTGLIVSCCISVKNETININIQYRITKCNINFAYIK